MFGDQIKKIRKSNKMSQVEFAEILNVSKQSVSNWENNNIEPSIEIVRTIAIKLNVSADFLLETDNRQICIYWKFTDRICNTFTTISM